MKFSASVCTRDPSNNYQIYNKKKTFKHLHKNY